MKYIRHFNAFEKALLENKGSDFRFSLPLPQTQEELDEINNYPEFKTLEEIASVLKKRGRYTYGSSEIEFVFIRGGGLELSPRFTNYQLRLTRNGRLQYGSYPVGPSGNFMIQDWHHLIDFISVYIISKQIGENVDNISKFVFEGKPINNYLFKIIKSAGLGEILIEMAEKYNDPLLIDASIQNAKKKEESFITDPNLIEKTEAFKWFAPIYGLKKHTGYSREGCIAFTHFPSPYGIIDPLLRKYTPSFIFCLEGRRTGVIRVKTLKGLENAVIKSFKDNIPEHALHGADILNNKMKNFVLSQLGQPISKESFIERFKQQIMEIAIEKYVEGLEINPGSFNERNLSDLDNLIEVGKNIGENILNPTNIVDAIGGDPGILSRFYDKLDPEVAEEVFIMMGTNREEMESIRAIRGMGLI